MQRQIDGLAHGAETDFLGSFSVLSIKSPLHKEKFFCSTKKLTLSSSKPQPFTTVQRRVSEKYFIPKASPFMNQKGSTKPEELFKKEPNLSNKEKTQPTIAVIDMLDTNQESYVKPTMEEVTKTSVLSPNKRSFAIAKSQSEFKESGIVVTKYLKKIEGLTKSRDNVAGLFEELFEDLSGTLPQYSGLFKEMKHLAGSLKQTTTCNDSETLKVADEIRKTPDNFPKPLRIRKQKMRRNKLMTQKSTDLKLGTHSDTSNQEVEQQGPNKHSSPVIIPKLDLGKLANTSIKDYNEEFLEKVDEFSYSWRNGVDDIRTLAK